MNFLSTQLDALSNERLHLMILPTEQCNFRCTYCYETFEHRKMSAPVIAGVTALIRRRAAMLGELHLSWFGGEPLTAFDVVTTISRDAQRTAMAEGVAYSADMTTNAYHLDLARLDACLDLGITAFHVALDGDQNTHDQSRKLASGKGTFERIWGNLLALHRSDRAFEMLLRLHYTASNWRTIAAFAGQVRDTFGRDSRFSVYFHSIERFGGANDAAITELTSAEKATIERALFEAAGLPINAPGEATPICYAACGNSFVVRSTGRLAKCTIALSSDHNDIGTLLPDGTIEIDQAKFQRWVAPVIEGRWDDMACPLPAVIREVAEELAATQRESALV